MALCLPTSGFATTRGNQFYVHHKPFHVHGFNAYFLMAISVDPNTRPKLPSLLHDAARSGLNVARSWAFHDGGHLALQTSPGVYDENVFKALDYVLSEASRAGVLLILTLVDNWGTYGGKAQYVKWAQEAGSTLHSEDAFFTDSIVKGYYKNYVKKVLTRINTITGVAYKDDPTIFSWELMNEARCPSDPSGDTFQAWLEEMAHYVKAIDRNHLLAIGSEGFYGPSDPSRLSANPNSAAQQVGTDFLRNHKVAGIDYAGAHGYPDTWLGSNTTMVQQISFVQDWLAAHIADCTSTLQMPFLLGEFGLSEWVPGYQPQNRESLLATTYLILYISALSGGADGGCLLWQLLPDGLENFNDGYQIVLSKEPSISRIITQQSQRLQDLTASPPRKRKCKCPIKFKCW